MREEANPRKIQRRALDYGASHAPIGFSHSGSGRIAFAPVYAPYTFGSLDSSKSTPQLSRLIAIPLLESPATRSKQTTATSSNRYFFGHFAALPTRPLPFAKAGFSERFFPATSVRAY
jgi:hypothetical protein